MSEEQAHALLDGELDTEHAARLGGHLAHCRECRVKIGRLRSFLALLRRQGRVSSRAPASLHARVRALRPPNAPVAGADLHPPDEPA